MVSTESEPVCLYYRPMGKALELFHRQEPEVLVSGPAGTGKSLACLQKIDLMMREYPGSRSLIVRKTRESLTDSALVTFERDVLPPNDPIRRGPRRETRHHYCYPNGSEIVLGGFRQSARDVSGKIMSTEYDMIYVQEAIELSEAEWEALTTRLRNNRLPYQQLLADTNPDRPTHWLKRRCDAGKTLLLESRHEDNPTLWTGSAWTPAGEAYISKLDALTGARKQRLRYGRWVQSEGVVYEQFDRAVHIIDSFPIPRDWPRYLSVDFGFVNPFVCQWWAVSPDGVLYLYREIYHTQRLVEDHARQIKAICSTEPEPEALVCDHDAEDRATLERHTGWSTFPAVKDVSAGIQSVAERLRSQPPYGKPRLFIFADSLVECDGGLNEAKRPACTAEEFDSYIWANKGDRPLKENDHGMDAARYMVHTLAVHGSQPTEETRLESAYGYR